jgi:hypothetical protein
VRLSALSAPDNGYNGALANSGRPTALDHVPIDYYDNFSAYTAGKLKSIGKIEITYIDQFDSFDNRGRVKSIGNIKFAYNDRFDGFDNSGKVKSIGDVRVTYYDRFDGDDLKGKVKSIGNTIIKYYDRFDDPQKAGKIKSITGNTPHISISNITIEDEQAG